MKTAKSERCFVSGPDTKIYRAPSFELQRLFLLFFVVLFPFLDKHIGDPFPFCEAWTYSLLFKSRETFKLAEIQYLEAVLQTKHSAESFRDNLQDDDVALRFNITRLVVDRATGSSLFRLDLQSKGRNENTFTNVKGHGDSRVWEETENLLRSHLLSLSSLRRCDWVGQVIEEGFDPEEMVEKLQQQHFGTAFEASVNRYGLDVGEWNLDYVKLVGVTKPKKKPACTMKSLLCAVAHEMPSRPSLNPALAKNHLLVVDTSTGEVDSSSCFLIQCIDNLPKIGSKSSLQQKWAKRPFQYSSAINFEIAEMVMNILMTLCENSNSNHCTDTKRVLLDPTCGSGTFLALAMSNGFYVNGCDINPSAAEGTIRNLEYFFDKEKVNEYANVDVHDSCDPWRKDKSLPSNRSGDVSCVIANLPWGRNSVLYVNENERILRSVRSQIQTGTPCAFITRPSNSGEDGGPSLLFESTGFDVVGQSFVPQRDFLLPAGKKKRKKQTENSDVDGDTSSARNQNQCVVTIALAKEYE